MLNTSINFIPNNNIYEILKKNYIEKSLSHSIIIYGEKGIGKSTFVKFFTLQIFNNFKDHYQKFTKSTHIDLINSNAHPNFMLIDKEIDEKLFKNVYARYQNKVSELKCEEATLKSLNKSVFRDVNSAVLLLENLSDFYKKINYQLKQKLVSSVFPENLIFDGKKYRTTKPDKLVDLIFLLTKDLQSIKRKKVSKILTSLLEPPPH